MSTTTKTVDLNRFKDSVGFTLLLSRWGNRRIGNLDKIKTSSDPDKDQQTKNQLSLTKQLIVCEEYDKICNFQARLRDWIYERTVPSFFREGFQMTRLEGVEVIEKRLEEAQEELKKLVADLVEIYAIKVEESRMTLGNLFSERDYPEADELPAKFSISWNWIAFTVPDGLPPELRQKEQDKMERQFADAGQQITMALREAFQKLISHAADTLRTEPGEKKKKFKDSTIGNITQFIETFSARNLMNDVDLQKLVNEAKEILINGSPQTLRDYDPTREMVQKKFDDINQRLSGMITETRSRVFELDDEEPAPTEPPTP